MYSNGVYFYMVSALAYITVCCATMEVFTVRTGDSSKSIGTEPAPPLPTVGKWFYPKTDPSCVIVEFAVQMKISYLNTDNNTSFVLYNIPTEDTTVSDDGLCGNETNRIRIQWNATNSMTVEFEKNTTSAQFSLSSIKFDLMLENKTFPGINTTGPVTFEHRKTEFTTPIDMSYHCTKRQYFNLTTIAPTPDSNNLNATFVMAHVQLEAFNHRTNKQFATAKDCDAIDTPDIVPIAVGCALAALIGIVLIAYLVGRRRAQARGYLSM